MLLLTQDFKYLKFPLVVLVVNQREKVINSSSKLVYFPKSPSAYALVCAKFTFQVI